MSLRFGDELRTHKARGTQLVKGTTVTGGGDTGVIFAMNMSAPNNYGFDTRTVPSEVTYTNATGAGPSGGNALRVTHVIQGAHNQYTHGLSTASVESQPSVGTTRYIRLYYKIASPLNMFANAPQGGWENKFIINGNDDGDPTGVGGRVILYMKDPIDDHTLRWEWSKNIQIDGPDYTGPTLDTWHALQVSVTSGISSNAVLKLWHDNDNFSSPTGSFSGDSISTFGWGGAGFGSFADATLTTSGNVDYYIGGYEYASAFDSAWYSGMTS